MSQYFSQHLQKKLNAISTNNLTMVEAPAGFGKTTAVHYAQENFNGQNRFWHTAVESMRDSSREWFVYQIAKLDAAAGEQLREISRINRANAGKAASILLSMHVSDPCYLVLNNFYLVLNDCPTQILYAVSERTVEGLHLILISQNFGSLHTLLKGMPSVGQINARDFIWNTESILEYAAFLGKSVTRDQAVQIYEMTEGWVAAVSLQLENAGAATSDCLRTCDMNSLINNYFWRNCSPPAREYLLKIAPFDCLGLGQLKQLFTDQADNVANLLRHTPLMRYDTRQELFFCMRFFVAFCTFSLTRRIQPFVARFTTQLENGLWKNDRRKGQWNAFL